jgi:hypothetical protein
MKIALLIFGGFLIVVSIIVLFSTATIWLYDRGKLANAPLFDGGKLADPVTVKKVYEERVEKQHRLYIRLRQQMPWWIGGLVLGLICIVIGVH